MGKIQNLITNLAESSNKPTPAPPIGAEIGTSASTAMSSILGFDFDDDNDIKVEQFKAMLDNDGTVQALYNMIVMPILGSNWTIEADDPESPSAVEQAAWVEETLRMPPHKGGMSTPISLVLAQALRAVVEGFSAFEKVLDVVDGKIVYKKVAWRDPTTITMMQDDRGGFAGLRQNAFIGKEYKEVDIPLERSFVYTYGKEFKNLRGRSIFTSAYGNFDKKRRLLYLAEQQAQVDAFKMKIIEGKEGASQAELNLTVEEIDMLGVRATAGVPNGYKVTSLNDSGGLNLLPFIEFQNNEMARSVLAMFILLGTGSNSGGSYALSQDQSDFFVRALMSIRNSLTSHLTSYLISDLYDYNFATPEYGTFKFEDITDSTMDLLQQTFIKLVEKGLLPDSIAKGVAQKIADKLDIDVDLLNEAVPDSMPPIVEPVVPEPPTPEPPAPPAPPVNNSKHNLAAMNNDGWRRAMSPAELRVNFAGINNKMNTLEAECERTIRPIYNELMKSATSKIDALLAAGKYDKIDETIFDENIKNQYIKVLKESGLDAYTYGKMGASDEMAVKAPATPKSSKDFFQTNASTVVNKQLADLLFKIQTEVTKAQRKNQLSTDLSASDIIAGLSLLYDAFYNDNIGLTASIAIAMGVNLGRKDAFDAFSSDIYGYQYSALLDNRTCPTCEALDGKVLTLDEYERTSYDPPIHMGCRCIWVAIMKDELDPPEFTGFDITNDLLEPSLSKDLEDEIIKLSEKAAKKAAKEAIGDEVDRLLAED